MSFDAAWGFDPEKALKSQQMFQKCVHPCADEIENDSQEQRDPEEARIPSSEYDQIYKLRRMFRS